MLTRVFIFFTHRRSCLQKTMFATPAITNPSPNRISSTTTDRSGHHAEVRPLSTRLAPPHLNPFNPRRSGPFVQISEQLLQCLPRPLCDDLNRAPVVQVSRASFESQEARPRHYKAAEVHSLYAPAHNRAQSDVRLIVDAPPPGC